MPSAKEEVWRVKALLGWGENHPRYVNWRNGVRAWVRTNNIVGKWAAGNNLWSQLKNFAMAETGMPASGRRLLQGGDADMKKRAVVAFDKLLQDVLKKVRDTQRNLTMKEVAQLIAAAPDVALQADGAEQAENQDQGGQESFRRSVRLFLIDSGGNNIVKNAASGLYLWDGCPSHCIAIMKLPSLLEIVDKVQSKIPRGRFVRAIFGAIDNPTPPSIIPDSVHLQTDEEVEAFYDTTASKPIHLQVILYRNPAANAVVLDSPPPDDKLYFPKDFSDAPACNIDTAEDLDNLARSLAGKAKRTFPKRDEAFENKKLRVWKRMWGQKKVLRLLKQEHNGKFPNTSIIDSEDEEWDDMAALRPKIQDGEEMRAARPTLDAGVVACDAYLQGIIDPTLAHIIAARAAGQAAVDALWPPP